MIPWLGLVSILIALGASLTLAWKGLPALLNRAPVSRHQLKNPVMWLVIGASGALLILEMGLLLNDFSVAYIANNHRAGTPLVFTISSAWAALEGSIVLWGLVLAVFIGTAYRSLYGSNHPLAGATLSVLGMMAVFWFGVMATVANPFAVCTAAIETGGCAVTGWAPWSVVDLPELGRGANPLLQNHILMAIHPPVLYAGYVGLSVPFAIGMASLSSQDKEEVWLRTTRIWTLTAWSFLTAGIVLGAWWSYEVLGWGGYWAWDPVENASFIPWLLATAFLHSSVVQIRRGVLSSWNYVLVIGAFSATILGTFLTRSGVIASVHSFTQSSIGPVLLVFLSVILIASLTLFATRVHLIESPPRLDSLASREGVFLLNNLLLTVFAFVVLSGTLFPLAIEALYGDTVGVGRPFFDRWAVPISYCLILAMAVGPITPYRVARLELLWARVRTPLRLSLGLTALLVLIASRNRHVIVVTLLVTWSAFNIGRHALTLIRKRTSVTGRRPWEALLDLMRGDPGYWGGQISHIGVMALALGIAISANHSVSGTLDLSQGESTRLAGYELTYLTPFARSEPHREIFGARLEVTRGGQPVTVLMPSLNSYGEGVSPVVTPAVHSTLQGDLYVSLTRIDRSGLNAEVWVYPLQWMVWAGGLITAAGAGFSLFSAFSRRKPRAMATDA
ncbi:MAG: heme lyase CcmF/NrfE family subunit [Acidimicrobiia bacterium]|nr:heme lyase CcmF/NrfE family subunit [Acidimicrobiia bacterium]